MGVETFANFEVRDLEKRRTGGSSVFFITLTPQTQTFTRAMCPQLPQPSPYMVTDLEKTRTCLLSSSSDSNVRTANLPSLQASPGSLAPSFDSNSLLPGIRQGAGTDSMPYNRDAYLEALLYFAN